MLHTSSHTFAVCAYGESPFLRDCVESVLNQSLQSMVFIATSTSNAHIEAVARDYEVPLFVSGRQPGIAFDWNHALRRVKTAYATIAHQDDVYLRDYAKVAVESMEAAAAPLIFFSNYGELRNGIADDDNPLLSIKRRMLSPLKHRSFWTSRWIRRRILSFGSPICCPAVTYNLSRLDQPIFTDDFKCDLDWQAWERLSKLDGAFVYSDRILMRHRIHEGSETTALIHDDTRSREDLAMFRMFWPTPVARLLSRMYLTSQKSNDLS